MNTQILYYRKEENKKITDIIYKLNADHTNTVNSLHMK